MTSVPHASINKRTIWRGVPEGRTRQVIDDPESRESAVPGQRSRKIEPVFSVNFSVRQKKAGLIRRRKAIARFLPDFVSLCLRASPLDASAIDPHRNLIRQIRLSYNPPLLVIHCHDHAASCSVSRSPPLHRICLPRCVFSVQKESIEPVSR